MLTFEQGVIAVDRAAEPGDQGALDRLADPKREVLTRIAVESTPPGLHKVAPDTASRIDLRQSRRA
ncbi:hypothetical protein AB0393_16045 [Streptomyces cyaneofuscatus]|uniref:hypothetical protein n=1 Tax=Streptomyces TaxID=1883 RepID=UPI00344E5EBD